MNGPAGKRKMASWLAVPLAGVAALGVSSLSMTQGVSGAWTTETINSFSVTAPVPFFTQQEAADITGTPLTGAQETSSVDGTITTQLSSIFGALAPNEPVTTSYFYVENVNTDAVSESYSVAFTSIVMKDAADNLVDPGSTDYNAVLANYNLTIGGAIDAGVTPLTTTLDTLFNLASTPTQVTLSGSGAKLTRAVGEGLVLSFSGDTNDAIPTQYAGWTIDVSVTITADPI